MELLGPKAKKRVAKFNAFATALVESHPSRVARQQGEFSTEHALHYLNITHGRPCVNKASYQIVLVLDVVFGLSLGERSMYG